MSKERKRNNKMSDIRKTYMHRLVIRCVILVLSLLVCIYKPSELSILHGTNFFREFSVFHILWVIWVFDMIQQLMPVKNHISLGSQKLFLSRFKPIKEKINYAALREHVISTTKSAYKIFILWSALLAVLGVLFHFEVIHSSMLFMICVIFYVCDLICVLIWCPFRLIMKNRCCTTCRIFNWDHLMMFSPMLFINSFFSFSLIALAFAAWVVWELCFMMYPERFWEKTNAALACSECTDKLCTQYCQKLRKEPYNE